MNYSDASGRDWDENTHLNKFNIPLLHVPYPEPSNFHAFHRLTTHEVFQTAIQEQESNRSEDEHDDIPYMNFQLDAESDLAGDLQYCLQDKRLHPAVMCQDFW